VDELEAYEKMTRAFIEKVDEVEESKNLKVEKKDSVFLVREGRSQKGKTNNGLDNLPSRYSPSDGS
jgi:hypothetical protein